MTTNKLKLAFPQILTDVRTLAFISYQKQTP